MVPSPSITQPVRVWPGLTSSTTITPTVSALSCTMIWVVAILVSSRGLAYAARAAVNERCGLNLGRRPGRVNADPISYIRLLLSSRRMDATPGFRPLYRQVHDLLVSRIVAGEWKPGDALPPEPSLARSFKVSQGTVRKALAALEQRNLVVRRQGKGTYVATHTPQRALFHFFHLVGDDGARALPSHRLLGVATGPAAAGEQRALGVRAGAAVTRLKRLRLLGARVAIVERIAVPRALFPGLDEDP